MYGTKESCTCDICKEACRNKPGWFMPGEAELTAKDLGITIKDLFDTKLAVDWWVAEENIYILSPAIVGSDPGSEFPGNPRGRCIFYDNGLCEIHSTKPFECREMIHGEQNNGNHEKISVNWDNPVNQEQIKGLLGKEPESEDLDLLDFLSLF